MKILINLLLLLLALFFSPSHEVNQNEALTKFLKEKRSRLNDTQEWSPPTITNPFRNGSQKGSKNQDRISGLPGQPPNITFAQYSGHVIVDSNAGRALFYYFAEATEDPATKPLLLWLNGGPGCSSLIGAMMELGPFRVRPDNKTLYTNPYAWNKVANTLFLESPAGVGFSYSNTSSDYDNGNDTKTAIDSYTFLLNWFDRFPEYKFRDFYIAGESYAGYYVPQLADTILKNNNSRTSFIKLKGVMVGNGIMNDETDNCGSTDFWWSHGLMSDEDYNSLRCNGSTKQNQIRSLKAESNTGLDIYNIYSPLCPSHPDPIWWTLASSTTLDAVGTAGLNAFDPCSPGYMFVYLNTREVQKSFHANFTDWGECSHVLSYTSNTTTVFPQYRRMIAVGLRILVYSGDVDGRVPVTGTKYSIDALNLPVETPWYLWKNSDIEVGGYSIVYRGLTFATVRGAGHEVPSYQPSRALTMATYFLAGKPLPSK